MSVTIALQRQTPAVRQRRRGPLRCRQIDVAASTTRAPRRVSAVAVAAPQPAARAGDQDDLVGE